MESHSPQSGHITTNNKKKMSRTKNDTEKLYFWFRKEVEPLYKKLPKRKQSRKKRKNNEDNNINLVDRDRDKR